MMDILVPCRDGENNPSLVYTLRSIEKNVPHRKIWLAGGKPSWVSDEIGFIRSEQFGSPYTNVHNNLRAALRVPELADEFLYFNDDFYVLRPVTSIPPLFEGTLAERVDRLRRTSLGEYTRGAELTLELLTKAGFEKPLNYDLHVPMPMTKIGLDDTLGFIERSGRTFWPHMRSIYGALNGLDEHAEQMADVKITTQIGRPSPEETYLSTSLRSLVTGSAGWHLRKTFFTPSRYESEASTTLPSYA